MNGNGNAPVTRIVPREGLYLLEAWGAAPEDTVVRMAADSARVIILRHGPPDNTEFARLEIPADGLMAGGRDSATITLLPQPGVYGLDISSDVPLKPGAVLTFKYAFHFSAPAGARARYGSNVALERALVIGRPLEDSRVALLPVTRPAADNLRATIPAAGRYFVVAPPLR